MCKLIWQSTIIALLLAGCAPLPPHPQDAQAKRLEPVPGKSVIYLLRDRPDFSSVAAPVMLDDNFMGTTYEGTYFRWEVAPGNHRIAGFASDSAVIDLTTQPGQVYFVQQRMSPWSTSPRSNFYNVREQDARQVLTRSQIIPSP